MTRALPERVVEAFAEQSTVTLPALARLLGVKGRALRDLIRIGVLPAHVKGVGRIRKNYVFTQYDVEQFFQRPETPPAQDPIFEMPEPLPAVIKSGRARPRNRKGNKPAEPRLSGFVYFVSDGKFVKIGWATNWKRRVAVIQSTNPNDLMVLAVVRGSTFHEKALHRKFEKHHARGEWHLLHDEIKIYIANLKHLNCAGDE